MNEVTPEQVRQFLLRRYADHIQGKGLYPANVPDTFDFFLEGAVDSLGILEMVTAVEHEFRVELDMASLDAERMTILGPLSQHVAQRANLQGQTQKAAQDERS
jgi:acyl carrier protein